MTLDELPKPHSVHVIPEGDTIDHEESIACPCQPKQTYEDPVTGNTVVTHNSISGEHE